VCWWRCRATSGQAAVTALVAHAPLCACARWDSRGGLGRTGRGSGLGDWPPCQKELCASEARSAARGCRQLHKLPSLPRCSMLRAQRVRGVPHGVVSHTHVCVCVIVVTCVCVCVSVLRVRRLFVGTASPCVACTRLRHALCVVLWVGWRHRARPLARHRVCVCQVLQQTALRAATWPHAAKRPAVSGAGVVAHVCWHTGSLPAQRACRMQLACALSVCHHVACRRQGAASPRVLPRGRWCAAVDACVCVCVQRVSGSLAVCLDDHPCGGSRRQWRLTQICKDDRRTGVVLLPHTHVCGWGTPGPAGGNHRRLQHNCAAIAVPSLHTPIAFVPSVPGVGGQCWGARAPVCGRFALCHHAAAAVRLLAHAHM
jgi:hypothetical protein